MDKKGARAVATAYLECLYAEEGQDIVGKKLLPLPISDKAHFADGASFDQIYTKK